jgi:hypothetical protein
MKQPIPKSLECLRNPALFSRLTKIVDAVLARHPRKRQPKSESLELTAQAKSA